MTDGKKAAMEKQKEDDEEGIKRKTKKKKEKHRKHVCHVCQKSFLGSNDLRKHVRIHTDERPFACTECDKAFRQAGSLKNHVTTQHSNDCELFVCDYCNKTFPIKERLRLHMRIHTGLKPYTCNVCDKSFARGGQLVQHTRTHTGLRPYSCNFCSASFTCSANLKSHVKRHQEIRDYVCDVCGKSFFRRDALRKHLNCFHGNVRAFHCKICDKMLKGHLPQHMRMHRKEKPHGCAHCGARFAQRSQLTVHQRVHSGEKPYRCQVCWKAFAHSTALKLHTRRHTGEKPFRCILCDADNVAFSQLPHLKKHMLCIHKTSLPYVCEFCRTFHKTKNDLETHKKNECEEIKRKTKTATIVGSSTDDDVKEEEDDEDGFLLKKKRKKSEGLVVEPPMRIEKMRLLLAVLLKKISAPERLDELGFNKKLIDDVLIESIESSGRKPCFDADLTEAERLKVNVQILLDWTVPKHYMDKFKNEQRSTEELLEELTS